MCAYLGTVNVEMRAEFECPELFLGTGKEVAVKGLGSALWCLYFSCYLSSPARNSLGLSF